MPEQPRFERRAQNRIMDLFTDPARPDADGLSYCYLGEWNQRGNNRSIETPPLRENLAARGYSSANNAAGLREVPTSTGRLQ